MSSFGLHAALALMWVPLYVFLAVYFAALSRREQFKMYFSLLWGLMGVYAFASAGLYSSPTPEVGLQWQRIQMLSAAYAFPSILLFVSTFAGHRLRARTVALLYGVSSIFAVGIFTTPYFFSSHPDVKDYALWGMRLHYPEVGIGWMGMACFTWGMLILGVSTVIALRATLQRRPGASILLVGLLVVIPCSVLDILVASRVIQFIYLVEHGFAAFAIAAAFFMLDRMLAARREQERQSERLLQANTELQSLDAMKEALLANISHELRTPLVSIRGYAEIMLDGKLGPVTEGQAKGLRVALRNVSRLLGLIANLLDYAKLRDGRVKLRRRVLDLRDVISESVDAALPESEAAELRLRMDLPEEDRLLVRGDAGKLRQVFDNLLSNAIKFTPAGGEIRVQACRAPEGWIQAAVEDTGVGIPPQDMHRIFDRFYQVRTSSQAPGRGMSSAGVGLAIVRELVRLHRGDVQAKNLEHKGSRFEVRLPKAAKTEDMVLPSSRKPRPEGESAQILLVDDDREVVEFLSLALGAEGHSVQVAPDGASGLRYLKEHDIDLVLLDLTMAGIGGMEVLQLLRAEPRTARLPIIVLTALAGDETRHRCLALGADDFLLKPVSVEDLRVSVTRALGRASQNP